MEHIAVFFDRIRSIALPNERVRRETLSAIREKIGIELDMGDIRIQCGKAIISTDASAKSEIFMRKRALLAALADRLGNKSPTDIL